VVGKLQGDLKSGNEEKQQSDSGKGGKEKHLNWPSNRGGKNHEKLKKKS